VHAAWFLAFFSLIPQIAIARAADCYPSPFFNEQTKELRIEDARVLINAPGDLDPARPTRLIFYALPNGNTIEQTIGCAQQDGLDWHYYIQHIGAQARYLRDIDRSRNIVIAYLEADGKSWPDWRDKRPDYGERIRRLVSAIAKDIPGNPIKMALVGHSGGGSFIFGYIDGGDAIDTRIIRIAFLDANYYYSTDEHHGDKLLAWLRGDKSRQLIVVAYDDRNIELNGKRVVSDTGGTFRASHRMLDFLSRDLKFETSTRDNIEAHLAMDGQIRFDIHLNPENKILHTRLVEWNGFLHAMTCGTELQDKCGTFCGDAIYTKWIQPAPSTQPATAPSAESQSRPIPARPDNAPGGHAFAKSIESLSGKDREEAILREISRGNLPQFERAFATIRVSDGPHEAEYQVMPDYLEIGSDSDFVRMPMTPMTAQAIADAFACALPTRKMVDDIYKQSKLKLAPIPLTEKREAVSAFVEHNDKIGETDHQFVAGIKKDIVITNRLNEKPHRVAIYGWHQLDGKPIQPLTIVHTDTYVDYSHGVRLVKRDMIVDGKATTVNAVLRDPKLCALLSDEGVIESPAYR